MSPKGLILYATIAVMIIVVLVAFGLIFGSFVNASIWRLHEQERLKQAAPGKKASEQTQTYAKQLSIAQGRSMCPHCKHELAAKDLVPLLSWLWLRGKCRYCSKKIDDNPLVEAFLPVFFVVSYLLWPVALHGQGLFDFIVWLGFLVAFIALAAYDLRWYILPNKIVYPAILVAIAKLLVDVAVFKAGGGELVGGLLGVLCIAGLFYGLFVLSDGRWIGGGDVKLGVVLGIWAGTAANALFLIFVASLLGLAAAIPMIMRGQANRKSQLPFGPFLLLSTVVTVLIGSSLVDAYLNLFRV